MEIRKATASKAAPGDCMKDECLHRLKKGLGQLMKQKSIKGYSS